MTIFRFISLLSVVVAMSAGQILFKLAAQKVGPLSMNLDSALRVVFNPYLILGIFIYGVTTVLWVVMLTSADLSRSYPFVALSMIIVPLAGIVLFNEPLTPSLIIGGLLVVAGVVVISA